MSLLTIIIVIVVIGLIMWAINTYIPMQPGVKKILNIAVIVILIIWILKALNVFSYMSNIRV